MSALPKILTGIDNFKKLVLESDLFVDKSMFIKEIIEASAEVLLIARPRRWGKSMNMSMLQTFLMIETAKNGIPVSQKESVNHKLFTGGEVDLGLPSGKTKRLKSLKIADHPDIMEDYQGKYPVILISFKEAKGTSYEEIEAVIKLAIKTTFDRHCYLESSDNITARDKEIFRDYINGNIDSSKIKNSLFFLSDLLHKHFGRRVWILVDEYDTPINHTYSRFGYGSRELEDILLLFRGILGAALKSNDNLERGVITGILRVAKANLFSDINNIRENTLLDRAFAKHYGFTQTEVDELLAAYPTETPSEKIKLWYNGYNFGGETIYNPWSIMMCLGGDGVLEPYWNEAGGIDIISKVLVSDKAQKYIQTLLDGDSIVVDVTKQINFGDLERPESFMSLMLFAGYLNPHTVSAEESVYSLSIPNQEVKSIYKLRVRDWVIDKLKTDTIEYRNFATLLADNKPEEFKAHLKKYLLTAASFIQTGEKNAEAFYNGFMLCLCSTLLATHYIESERESGKGRPDMVLVPKPEYNDKLAIIFEYKIAENANAENLMAKAEEALQQIEGKKYDTKLKEQSHIKQIMKVGIAFSGKDVDMVYALDKNCPSTIIL
jgi:hypothetical protein